GGPRRAGPTPPGAWPPPPAGPRGRAHGGFQLALPPTGLAALGAPADVIDMMAPEATAGMASRGRVLADPDPATWQLGGPSDRLDALIMVYARDAETRAAELARHPDAPGAAGATVRPAHPSLPLRQAQQFGFRRRPAQPH